jgi:hypothetical protein
MLGFIMTFGDVASRLDRILGARYIPGSPDNDTPIGRSLYKVLELHNEGRTADRDANLARLMMLLKHLTDVEAARPDLMPRFREQLMSPSLSAYFGARHEVQVAASLIHAGFYFDHEVMDGPDFTLHVDGAKPGIECTSAHTVIAKDDLNRKIEDALAGKAGRPYATPDVALSIERTAIDHLQSTEAAEGILTRLPSLVQASRFGAVLLHVQMLNRDETPPTYQANYNRVDSPAISVPLRAVLDALFPLGRMHVEDYTIPSAP